MIKKFLLPVFITALLVGGGCVKETYDMKKLSKKAHLSPTFAVSAVKGQITLGDIIKPNDTVVFGQDKFVKIVFRIDSVLDFVMADFIISKSIDQFKPGYSAKPDSKQLNTDFGYANASLGQRSATLGLETIDFDIKDILSHLTGTFGISNPSIKIDYVNSFTNPIDLDLKVSGFREDKIVDLNLAPVPLLYPVAPSDKEVTASFKIDKSNSSLPELISMLPEKMSFSGSAVMNIIQDTYLPVNARLVGSLEVELPLEFHINNLQFTDTIENFMIEKDSEDNNPVKPENFDLLRIDIDAINGFPVGAGMSMSLYNPLTNTIINTVDATDIIKPAQVDGNGKVTTPTASVTSIEFTKEFFNEINNAPQIILTFKLNSTDNGSKDVKIYSDYMINFKAALVLKPDILIDL